MNVQGRMADERGASLWSRLYLGLACGVLWLAPGHVLGADLYVHPAPQPVGAPWSGAHTTLQSALAAALNGDTIHVAGGVYTPATANDSFEIDKNLTILGSYTGVGLARDLVNNPTILSGDILGNDGVDPDNIPCDCLCTEIPDPTNPCTDCPASCCDTPSEAPGGEPTEECDDALCPPGCCDPSPESAQGGEFVCPLSAFCLLPRDIRIDNAANVITIANAPEVSLDGLIVTSGGGSLAGVGNPGAGILVLGISSPGANITIDNCSFIANIASESRGGAIAMNSGDLTVLSSEFIGNEASRTASSCQSCEGGAIAFTGGGTIRIEDSAFRFNKAWSPAGVDVHGGAISYVEADGDPLREGSLEMERVVFEKNHSFGSGGAVYTRDIHVDVESCTFVRNVANEGHGGGLFRTSGEDRKLEINNSVFSRNQAISMVRNHFISGKGGGFYYDGNNTTGLVLTNSSFSMNHATRSGGGMHASSGSTSDRRNSIHNSIFFDNTTSDTDDFEEAMQIHVAGTAFHNPTANPPDDCNNFLPLVTHSLIQGYDVGALRLRPITNGCGPLLPPGDCGNRGCSNINNDDLIVSLVPLVLIDPFEASGADDLHLSLDRPIAINFGDNARILPDAPFDVDGDLDEVELTPFDLDENPRFVGAIDAGAYEVQANQCSDCPEDLTGAGGVPDGVVNVLDLLGVIGAWGAMGGPADVAPIPGTGVCDVGDGVVNVLDLLAVIGAWGPCGGPAETPTDEELAEGSDFYYEGDVNFDRRVDWMDACEVLGDSHLTYTEEDHGLFLTILAEWGLTHKKEEVTLTICTPCQGYLLNQPPGVTCEDFDALVALGDSSDPADVQTFWDAMKGTGMFCDWECEVAEGGGGEAGGGGDGDS